MRHMFSTEYADKSGRVHVVHRVKAYALPDTCPCGSFTVNSDGTVTLAPWIEEQLIAEEQARADRFGMGIKILRVFEEKP